MEPKRKEARLGYRSDVIPYKAGEPTENKSGEI
jgi:hypothetical protein